eukprot:COSAG06_NODE_6172_length_3069_cov_3.102020_3_plen_211_part_00
MRTPQDRRHRHASAEGCGRRYHWHPRVLHAPLRLSKGYEQGSVTNSSPRVPLCGTLPGHSILSGGGTGDQPEMPMAVSGWSPMAADECGTWGNKLAEDLFPAPPSGLRFHYSVVYTRLATQTHSACPLSISLFYVSAGERSIGFAVCWRAGLARTTTGTRKVRGASSCWPVAGGRRGAPLLPGDRWRLLWRRVEPGERRAGGPLRPRLIG